MTVLNIGKLAAGSEGYYPSTVARGVGDYYTGAGEAPGYWLSQAAQDLDLAGRVEPDMASTHINRMAPGVWVGPVPERVRRRGGLGHHWHRRRAQLQTEEDLLEHGVDTDRVGAALCRHGMLLHRAPIRDFDEDDLVRHLPEAVARLQELVAAGHETYVHCTAGIGRSSSAT